MENIIHMNFESLRYEELKDFRRLYETISQRAEQTSGRIYILLDEIQEVAEWEKVVNSLRVDFDCDIYITAPTRGCCQVNWQHCLRGAMSRSMYTRWTSRNTWTSREKIRQSKDMMRSRISRILFAAAVCRDCIR